MDKKEKHELAARKDIPFLTRLSLLYGDATSARALILALPHLGSSIDLILSKNGQDYVIKRIDTFLEEINSRLKVIENDTIKINDEEALFDLFQTAFESVSKTRSKQKIKRFAAITSDCLIHDRNWDETEAAMRLISDLTDTHIQILDICENAPISESEAFNGLRATSVLGKNKDLDIQSLITEFDYLSDAALKMYCSELVARGLLHDEGIGRWDTGSIELIVPTDLTSWLLDKIKENA